MNNMSKKKKKMTADNPMVGGELFAVIEIGTTSVRMAIASRDNDGNVVHVENLQQPLALGKDTFTLGFIAEETTEACVEALRRFQIIIKEYNFKPQNIRAVATSAVREAENNESFIDRIYVATNLSVDIIDEAEVNRFTYLAVHPFLEKYDEFAEGEAIVIEVGGGSTELIHFMKGDIVGAQGYRLGSLRLKKLLDEEQVPKARFEKVLVMHVDRGIGQIRYSLGQDGKPLLIALGGDARFAASQIVGQWDKKNLVKIPLSDLHKFTKGLVNLTAEEIVNTYHIAYQDAETLGPALMIYTRLAQTIGLKNILVCTATLRDGVLLEMMSGEAWTENFQRQILSSAREIGRKYNVDMQHAENVAHFALQLFSFLQNEHKLSARYKLFLNVAALLHEVGAYVSTRNHHKHSLYLIMNCDIFGFGAKDLRIIALIARYHRRAEPKMTHEYYNILDRESRVIISKLAAILRVADALDRSHSPVTRDINVVLQKGTCIIKMKQSGDFTLEQQGLREKSDMFEHIYGYKVVLEEK